MSKTKLSKAATKLAKADRRLERAAKPIRDHPVVQLTGLLAEVADQPELIAASVGTLLVGIVGRRPELIRGGARMLAAHLVATGGKALIKSQIDRTRPKAEGKADRDAHDENSFPSGHTAGVVAVGRAVSREFEGAGTATVLVEMAVAAVQPATGAHFFTDVVAGAALGWVSEALVSAVFDRVEPVVENAIRQRFGHAGDDGAIAAPRG